MEHFFVYGALPEKEFCWSERLNPFDWSAKKPDIIIAGKNAYLAFLDAAITNPYEHAMKTFNARRQVGEKLKPGRSAMDWWVNAE